MSDRNKAFELQERLQENGISAQTLLDFIINNYSSGSYALGAMQSAVLEFLEEEDDEDEEEEVLYEVCTFDSTDKPAICVEGDLTYQRALDLAKELFDTGKYFGVEVISLDPEELLPICWVKTILDDINDGSAWRESEDFFDENN